MYVLYDQVAYLAHVILLILSLNAVEFKAIIECTYDRDVLEC